METERLGSTRVMTPVERGVIALKYTDRWSAFDRGSSPQEIPGIGKARCACAVNSFEILKGHQLPTHYVEQVADDTIHVLEFSIPGRQSLSGHVHGRVIPLEWLWRARVKGSLLERITSGEIKPEDIGFSEGEFVADGAKLPRMLLECTTKFEHVDRHLTNAEAMKLGGLDQLQFTNAQNLLRKGMQATNFHYESVGFEIPDGKVELGMSSAGIIFVDVLGTQDENRILDTSGKIYSKDLIRNHLKSLPWYQELLVAKKDHPKEKSKWPVYPQLPDEVVDLVSARYKEVALRYAGVRI